MAQSRQESASSGQRTAIVGSGPCSLIKAIFLAQENPNDQIIIIDSASKIGGAWFTDQSPSGYDIESGCNIWTYVPEAYEFIEKNLGIKLYPVAPSPVFVGGKIRLPYSLKNTIDSYKTVSKLLLKGKWNQIKKLKEDPSIQYKIFYKRNKYPSLGSAELIHKLEQEIKKNKNIVLHLNTEIKELNIENARVKISTSDLKEQVYDQIYLTHVSRINSLIILDQRKEMQFRKVNYIHFLISLDKPLKKKISYWRLINDELIHRITDISPQTDFKENLIMVALKEVVFSKNGESETFKKVLTKLNKFGLIDHQYKCMLVKTQIFESNYLSQDNIAELDKIGSHVKIIHTTDLMHGIYFLLHKREEKTEKII